MKTIYIAAPFRDSTPWQQELNIRYAEEAALGYWKRGYAALCPHSMTRFYQGECLDEVWLKGTIELMKQCDVVVFLEGWYASEGCREEERIARENDMEIWYA